MLAQLLICIREYPQVLMTTLCFSDHADPLVVNSTLERDSVSLIQRFSYNQTQAKFQALAIGNKT